MSNYSDDPNVTIVARMDTTGVTAGAGDVVQAVQRVEDKVKEGGEAFDGAALTNLRSVHHLVGGLIEMREGGVTALGGLAAEGRVLTEVFEGMLGPLAPVALALSTIAMIAIPMFTRALDEQSKKQEEANKKLDEANAKLDERNEKKMDETVKKETEAIKDQTQAGKDWLETEKEIAGFSEQGVKATESQIEAEHKLSLARLEAQKIKELEGATSKEQKDEIEARYKVREAEVTGASDIEKARLETAAVQGEIGANQEQAATVEQNRNVALQTLTDLQAKAKATADAAAELGIKPDESGSFEDAYKASLADWHEKQKITLNDSNKLPGQQDEDTTQEIAAQKIEGAAFRADQAQKALKEESPELQKTVDENNKAWDKLNYERDLLNKKLETAKTTEDATGKEAQNKVTEEADAGAGKAAEDHYKALQDAIRATTEAHRQVVEAQKASDAATKKAIDEMKKLIAARPDHAALEPMVKAAEALATPAQEVAQLQQIMGLQVGTIVDAHMALRGEVEKTKGVVSQVQKKVDQMQRDRTNNHQS